jgi:hypothetical protein
MPEATIKEHLLRNIWKHFPEKNICRKYARVSGMSTTGASPVRQKTETGIISGRYRLFSRSPSSRI